MDINLDLVGHEPLGQLRYAKLQLRCAPLINGTLIERFVVHLFESKVSDRDLFVLRATGLIRYDQDDKFDGIGKTVYFLPLFERRGKSDVGVRLYGLMVLAADGGSEGHFSRIGNLMHLRTKGYMRKFLSLMRMVWVNMLSALYNTLDMGRDL